MVVAAKAAGVRVVLLTPTPIHENPASPENARLASYVKAMTALGARHQCTVVDLNAAMTRAIAAHQREAGPRVNVVTTDGVHLNAAGNQLVAWTILRALGVPDRALASRRPRQACGGGLDPAPEGAARHGHRHRHRRCVGAGAADGVAAGGAGRRHDQRRRHHGAREGRRQAAARRRPRRSAGGRRPCHLAPRLGGLPVHLGRGFHRGSACGTISRRLHRRDAAAASGRDHTAGGGPVAEHRGRAAEGAQSRRRLPSASC